MRADFRHGRFLFRLALCTLLVAEASNQLAASDRSLSEIRTPKAPNTPKINGARVYGVRPGHPFLYRIACTGVRPIHFSVKSLPPFLQVNATSGIISGKAPQKTGEYRVMLEASNSKGKSRRALTIVVGDEIGLTPQMGWNDWYTHYDHVSDKDIRSAADAMVASGMADYGYQYISIDDGWATKPDSDDPTLHGPSRDAKGAILPNRRFPDMRSLADYIHSKGLKAGVYSSPGPLTCAGFQGSYQHEAQDADQFSQWGFDLLKYDWCSYTSGAHGEDLEDHEDPYRKMSGILHILDRDVVFNICQYGRADVWKWGRKVGGNSWRTTGDLGLEKDTVLPGFYSIGFTNAVHSDYAGPGGWNDPDYILIGKVGNARDIAQPAHSTQLTAEEQYSYMSMWSLMAAPLFFSGDMTALDEFTLNVLCNSEVIDIDQDSLGKQARIVRKTDREFVLVKSLEDGSVAVGLFNLTVAPRVMRVRWTDLGLTARQRARDVWRQKNLGLFDSSFSSTVPGHGVVLVRLTNRR
jgi:alpha-galactosidase